MCFLLYDLTEPYSLTFLKQEQLFEFISGVLSWILASCEFRPFTVQLSLAHNCKLYIIPLWLWLLKIASVHYLPSFNKALWESSNFWNFARFQFTIRMRREWKHFYPLLSESNLKQPLSKCLSASHFPFAPWHTGPRRSQEGRQVFCSGTIRQEFEIPFTFSSILFSSYAAFKVSKEVTSVSNIS